MVQLGLYELEAAICTLNSSANEEDSQLSRPPTPGGGPSTSSATLLPTLYRRLLESLLADGHSTGISGRLEARWEAVLDSATWLEVVRRYLISRKEDKSSEGEELFQLLSVLGRCEVEDISRVQQARLLRLLVDEVLECEEIRKVRIWVTGGTSGSGMCIWNL